MKLQHCDVSVLQRKSGRDENCSLYPQPLHCQVILDGLFQNNSRNGTLLWLSEQREHTA